MRLFLLGDFHLDARLGLWGSAAAARRRALESAWDEAMSLARDPENAVDAVLMAGSLFDRPNPSVEQFERVMHDLDGLARAGKPVVLVPGPRDGESHPHSIYRQRAVPDGVHILGWGADQVNLDLGETPLTVTRWSASIPSPEGDGLSVSLGIGALGDGPLPWGVSRVEPADRGGLVVLGGGYAHAKRTEGSTLYSAVAAPVATRRHETAPRLWTFARHDGSGWTLDSKPCSGKPVVAVEVDVTSAAPWTADAIAERVRPQIQDAAFATVRLTGSAGGFWNAADLETSLARTAPVWIEDAWIPVVHESGPAGSMEAAFRASLDTRRAGASDRESRVLDRALAHGIRVLRTSEAGHAD